MGSKRCQPHKKDQIVQEEESEIKESEIEADEIGAAIALAIVAEMKIDGAAMIAIQGGQRVPARAGANQEFHGQRR
jgi:predicted LPLAT superfamily acyltransferase